MSNESVGDYVARTMHGARAFTHAQKPESVRCAKRCGKQSHPEFIEWMGRWFHLSTCDECRELERLDEDREYIEGIQGVARAAALRRAGLHEAEMAYNMKWMDPRMKCLNFAGDKLEDSERELPIWRYIWGDPGTGTTTQIALAVRHYVEKRRKSALLVSCQALVETLYPGGSHTPQDYINLDLLAIDKFGVGISRGSKNFGGDSIYNILAERERRRKPTLFASPYQLPSAPGKHSIEAHENQDMALIAVKIFQMCVNAKGMWELTQQRRAVMHPERAKPGQQRRDAQGRMPVQKRMGRVIDEPLDPSPI